MLNAELHHDTSKDDLMKLWGGKIKVITYDQIKDYKTITELLYPYGKIIILYYWKKYTGHWISVFINKDREIEVFDSLGSNRIDGELSTINESFREANGEGYPYLSKLILASGYPYVWNSIQLQSDSTDTCGLWASYRLYRCDLSIKQFIKLFPDVNTNDEKLLSIVVKLI